MHQLTIFLFAVLTVSVRGILLQPSMFHRCGVGLFSCNNGKCIPKQWVCDLEDDCGDMSDEASSSCRRPSCGPSEFKCNSGSCIPQSWTCDGDYDCSEEEDEDLSKCIDTDVCNEDQFSCGHGQCIPVAWVCDRMNDCNNGNDEVNCTLECTKTEFKCSNGVCLTSILLCNGEDDCGDGSDERDCPNVCEDNFFKCDNGPCILESWKCDGEIDCTDQSDEIYCNKTITKTTTCKENEFQCLDFITCIPNAWVCNGNPECLDGSDEKTCDNVKCRLDEFLCKNRACIPGYLQCNGKLDCLDGSDEDDCDSQTPACSEDEFYCGEGICIPLVNACDGKKDCPKGEDEPALKCNVNECEIQNGGCSQICKDTPTSYYCKCERGFELIDNFTCGDVDECKNAKSCSQICINEKGAFKCECNEGYLRNPHDHRRCKATQREPSLIFTRRHDIRMLNLTNNHMRLIQNFTKSSIALDFAYESGDIFWSDGIDKKIFKSKISNEMNEAIPVIESNISISDGLAVDWIYHHIYWTDVGLYTINVANFDGSYQKTLITDTIEKPRAIVVNPMEGWMFFSDWGKEPRIERAGLDGSLRSVIVSHDVHWPNGLALDLLKRRLYWIDAKIEFIFSANFDGSARRIELKPTEQIAHPFSIALFEDTLYWTDWSNRAIFKVDILDGSNPTAVTEEGSLESPMVVHVYHPYKQPSGTNHCLQRTTSGMKCSHLCMPTPQSDLPADARPVSLTTCLCPDGLILTDDGKLCLTKEQISEIKAASKDLKMSDSASRNSKVSDDDKLNKNSYSGIIVAIASLVLLLLLAASVIYFYRRHMRRDVGSISFVNEIYRRCSEDNIPKSILQPQSSSQHLFASD